MVLTVNLEKPVKPDWKEFATQAGELLRHAPAAEMLPSLLAVVAKYGEQNPEFAHTMVDSHIRIVLTETIPPTCRQVACEFLARHAKLAFLGMLFQGLTEDLQAKPLFMATQLALQKEREAGITKDVKGSLIELLSSFAEADPDSVATNELRERIVMLKTSSADLLAGRFQDN